jgi:hypothetical protein
MGSESGDLSPRCLDSRHFLSVRVPSPGTLPGSPWVTIIRDGQIRATPHLAGPLEIPRRPGHPQVVSRAFASSCGSLPSDANRQLRPVLWLRYRHALDPLRHSPQVFHDGLRYSFLLAAGRTALTLLRHDGGKHGQKELVVSRHALEDLEGSLGAGAVRQRYGCRGESRPRASSRCDDQRGLR